MTFEGQPNEAWNGVYLKWFSLALDDLPENWSVPLIFCRENRLAAGDVFIISTFETSWSLRKPYGQGSGLKIIEVSGWMIFTGNIALPAVVKLMEM